MELRDLYIITIGFIILGLGLSFLNLREDSFFFFFPFFFAGSFAPILFLSTLFIMMICFWWVNKNWEADARFVQTQEITPRYLRVAASCQFCGAPIPERAVYCASCGHPVDENLMQ